MNQDRQPRAQGNPSGPTNFGLKIDRAGLAPRRRVRGSRERRARYSSRNREHAQQEDGPQTARACTVRCGAPPEDPYRPQACPEQSRRANERSHATGYEEVFGEASFEGASGAEAPVGLIFSGLFFSGLFFSVLFVSALFLSAPGFRWSVV
ncbi:MAG: hypothetical protein AUI83_04995 [Armatimonadetes bacterium 13_1_40CM_3_65_7]|nr:MAG: hypothetical protein AUI83_04995 [Armatimonadetes bacterium 13_1_40CM_3_65_7]